MFIKKYFLFIIFTFVFYINCNEIQNIHLAIAGYDSNDITISWLTSQPTFGSFVFYGTSPKQYTMNATSFTETSYDKEAGWNHNVILTNLNKGTTYYYICGSPSWALSEEYHFTTLNINNEYPKTFAAFGDLGVTHAENTISQLVNRTLGGDIDLFIHMGDISYANDHPVQYEKTWTKWFTELEPAMATTPYMVAPGNHESWCRNPICAIQSLNFTVYKEKFRMPGNESGTGTNMFYSFDYMNIHFVAISTESDYPGAPIVDPKPENKIDESTYFQINWLHEDLTKAVANRDNVPWIILFGHRPIYTPSDQDNGIPTGQASIIQSVFEPIIHQYKVDMLLSGHTHAYARTYPIYNNTVTNTNYINPSGFVNIVSGGSGDREKLTTFPTDKPYWYANGYDATYGFGLFTINNKSSLTWNYYLSDTGELIDSFTIEKDI